MSIEIVFDGPPSHEAGRFVEVEKDGKGIKFGEWREGYDGFWYLTLPDVYNSHDQLVAERDELKDQLDGCRIRVGKLQAKVDDFRAALEDEGICAP